MDIFDSRYFIITKKGLSCFGIWCYQKTWQKFLFQFFIFSNVISINYIQSLDLINNWGKNLDDVLHCLGQIILFQMGLVEVCIYSINQKKIMHLANCIRNDWKLWSSSYELKILREHAETGRNLTLLYFGYNFSAFWSYVLFSASPLLLGGIFPIFLNYTMKPLYPAVYPIDSDKYYLYILIHNYMTALYTLAAFCACDSMLAVTTQHACGLLAIVGYRLKNISIDFQSITNENVGKEKEFFQRNLFYFIKYHNYALRYIKVLESVYSPFLFFSLGINVLTISFSLVQTSLQIEQNESFIETAILALATISHVYFLGLPSQNLINQSTNISWNMYNSEWYMLPIKIKKIIPFIIRQGDIHCQLSIGKIATLNMETVSQILKMAFSYFTMLSAVSSTSK
ncbi:putative odorant receptor 85d [Leptopilina boulardi]|uniref:putative odorant receptor 85d n=1 Tax=Leptopilina boulardi TaxID=63433 RepID=UPI0021F55952|nr:putative odorant receptor 85d [Leptopilina boulardi]